MALDERELVPSVFVATSSYRTLPTVLLQESVLSDFPGSPTIIYGSFWSSCSTAVATRLLLWSFWKLKHCISFVHLSCFHQVFTSLDIRGQPVESCHPQGGYLLKRAITMLPFSAFLFFTLHKSKWEQIWELADQSVCCALLLHHSRSDMPVKWTSSTTSHILCISFLVQKPSWLWEPIHKTICCRQLTSVIGCYIVPQPSQG